MVVVGETSGTTVLVNVLGMVSFQGMAVARIFKLASTVTLLSKGNPIGRVTVISSFFQPTFRKIVICINHTDVIGNPISFTAS